VSVKRSSATDLKLQPAAPAARPGGSVPLVVYIGEFDDAEEYDEKGERSRSEFGNAAPLVTPDIFALRTP
jgi:hypothetical protein